MLDPSVWHEACDALASLFQASGALLIPEDTQKRSVAMPHSSSLAETVQRFLKDGWSTRDFRSQGFPKALAVGYVTDQDLISEREMSRHPYYSELLAPLDLKWFIGTAVKLDNTVWGAAIHASPRRGPFLESDARILLQARRHLARGMKQAAALGNIRIETLERVFEGAERGLAAIGWCGEIRQMNDRAEAILMNLDLPGGATGTFSARFGAIVSDALLDGLSRKAPPLRLNGRNGRLYSCDVIPMPCDFQSLLTGVRAVVTLHEIRSNSASAQNLLRIRFSLTRREAELVALLADGESVDGASRSMGVSVSTVRQQVKSVFRKTGTHRQAELVALLNRATDL